MRSECSHQDQYNAFNPELIHTPLPEVARVFLGFESPFARPWELKSRGGVIVPDRQPVLSQNPSQYGFDFSSDYHVESTFSLEEGRYVTTAMTLLAILASGRVWEYDRTLSFSERVEDNFRKGSTRFRYAVTDSSSELLEEFKKRYPNLIPAFDAGFQVGGKEGINLVISKSADFLFKTHNEPTLTIRDLTDSVFKQIRFEHAHSRGSEPSVKYEVHCAGIAVARVMLRQAAKAAINLSEFSDPPTLPTTRPTDSLANRIRSHIAGFFH